MNNSRHPVVFLKNQIVGNFVITFPVGECAAPVVLPLASGFEVKKCAIVHVVYSLFAVDKQGGQSRPAFCLFRLKRDLVVKLANTATIRSASGRARRGARLGFGNVLRLAGRANGGNPIALDNLAGPFPIRH